MAHKKQIEFCISVKETYPEYFKDKSVLDVGSLDINGNNRFLFTDCEYIGLDIGRGPNVDIVCPVHLYTGVCDIVICVNTLEHDRFYKESIKRMISLTREMLIISVPGPGHPEHGTNNFHPFASPYTKEYYRNLFPEELLSLLQPEVNFSKHGFYHYRRGLEMYFWGIKNNRRKVNE